MQNKFCLNNTRLSMALVDLPLTPIGMRHKSKKKAIRPSGKENHIWGPKSHHKKLENRGNGNCNDTELAASIIDIATFADEINKSNDNSVYTKVDDSSFVEFYGHGYSEPEAEKPLYYTCLTHTDTVYSTSSKRPSASVGFRQYVEAIKERQYQLLGKPDDDLIVSAAVNNPGRKFVNQVLNSTAKNGGSFRNCEFPDISPVKISPRMETLSEKNESVIISDSSPVRNKFVQFGMKRNKNKELSPPADSFITEDVTICSSANAVMNSNQVPANGEPLPNTWPSSYPAVCSPKKDVLQWVMSSPFKSPEAVNVHSKDDEFVETFSQNLLKLSEKSIEPLATNKSITFCNVQNKKSTKCGQETISTSYVSIPRLHTKDNVQLPPKKPDPVIIVIDSDEQSSSYDPGRRPPIRSKHRARVSSSASLDESSLTNVIQRASDTLSNENDYNYARSETPACIRGASHSSQVRLHLDTLESSHQTTVSTEGNIIIVESDDDSNIVGATSKPFTDKGINGQEVRPWRSPCTQSPDDSLHYRAKPFRSKQNVIISSSDSISDDNRHVISDDEDLPDTFTNLRVKLHKLIDTQSTNAEVKNRKNLPNQHQLNSLSSRSPLVTTAKTNTIVNDNSLHTSSSEEDCLFVRKKRPNKRCVKARQTSTNIARNISKDCEHNETSNKSETVSFLVSICGQPGEPNLHPDAIPFLKSFNKIKLKLTSCLYAYFNEHVFESKLPPDMDIKWNSRIRKTAGYCYYQVSKAAPSGRNSRIELSNKVIDSPDRLRDTLIHEMCHAASWIISGYKSGHGPLWKAWVSKAMTTFPELPVISRCHSYEIACKYTYECTKCGYSIGRHSKSLDVERKVCGRCRGTFKLVVTSTMDPNSTPKTPRTPGPFAVFVRENYSSVKSKRQDTHADVMKELSKQFNLMKVRKQNSD